MPALRMFVLAVCCVSLTAISLPGCGGGSTVDTTDPDVPNPVLENGGAAIAIDLGQTVTEICTWTAGGFVNPSVSWGSDNNAIATIVAASPANQCSARITGAGVGTTTVHFILSVPGQSDVVENLNVTVVPVPALASIMTAPPAPKATEQFGFNVLGTGFDQTNIEVLITGAGCSPIKCIVSHGNLTGVTASTLSGVFSPSAPGSYLFSARNGASGTLSNTLSVLVGDPPACANPVTPAIGDDFELTRLWTDSVGTTTGGSSQLTQRNTSGGNPGGYQFSQHTEPGPSTIGVFHRLDAFSYNPALGAIDHINYSEDHIEYNPPFVGAAIAGQFFIQQGTTFYVKSLGTFTNTAAWETTSLGSLTPADFTPSGLNFTTSGAVMHFGYYRANSNIGTLQVLTQAGIDNFSVTICR